MEPKKTLYYSAGILCLLSAVFLFFFFGVAQQLLGIEEAGTTVNPIGVIAITGIFLIGGMYFLKAGAAIIKEAIK